MRSAFAQSVIDLMAGHLASATHAAEGFTAYARNLGFPMSIGSRIERGPWFNAFASKKISLLGRLTRPFGIRRFDAAYEIVFYEGTLVRLAYFYEVITTIFIRNERWPDDTHQDIFVHYNQDDPGSKRIDIPTLANEPIIHAIFDDYETHDPGELARLIEAKLVLFEIGERPISNLARSSLEIAVRYLAMHECAHIIGGHLDYLDENMRLRALPEFRKDAAPVSDSLMQAMEVDADITAFMNLLVHLGVEKMDEEELYASLRRLYFCLASLFGAFDLSMRTAASYNLSSHPDPDHRFRTATSYGGAVAGSVNPAFAAAEKRALESAVNSVPRLFQELGVMGGGLYLFAASQTDEAMRKRFAETCIKLNESVSSVRHKWRRRVRGSTNPFAGGDAQ